MRSYQCDKVFLKYPLCYLHGPIIFYIILAVLAISFTVMVDQVQANNNRTIPSAEKRKGNKLKPVVAIAGALIYRNKEENKSTFLDLGFITKLGLY